MKERILTALVLGLISISAMALDAQQGTNNQATANQLAATGNSSVPPMPNQNLAQNNTQQIQQATPAAQATPQMQTQQANVPVQQQQLQQQQLTQRQPMQLAVNQTTPVATPTAQPQQAAAPAAPTAPTAQAPAAAQPQSPTNQPQASNSPFKTMKEKLSYTIGVDMGRNFKLQSIDIDPTIIMQGVKDGLAGGTTLMNQQEMQATVMQFRNDLMAKREADINAQKVKNKQEGDTFLAANRTKPGVVTLPDGLQYKVIQAGTGTQPADKDTVTVNYAGTFIDGKEFDSSYKRGKPVTFPLSDMIPGWIEALKLMKAGSTWEIYVPPSLGYGERGAPPMIGPNKTLIFKINLVDVKKQKS